MRMGDRDESASQVEKARDRGVRQADQLIDEFDPDFQLIKVLTNGGPAGATELMATMSYNTAILGGRVGEGAAISTAMVPFLLAAIMVSWFGLQRRKWQQGESND